MSEANVPIPFPFVVFVVRLTVGFGLADQTTPLVVTFEPPSDEIFPPLTAVLEVMEVTGVVIRVGTTAAVVVLKVSSFPYPVPALLVA